MEIKATLNKPYTEEQRTNFIIVYNHQNGYEIRETEAALEAWGYTEEEKAEERRVIFYNTFLETSQGNYRLQPKGYANAQQTFDIIDRRVSKAGALTEEIAAVVLFYETPDFTKPEECTEEWLIQHQYNIEPMTEAEWDTLYDEFTEKYMQKMYQQQLLEQQV